MVCVQVQCRGIHFNKHDESTFGYFVAPEPGSASKPSSQLKLCRGHEGSNAPVVNRRHPQHTKKTATGRGSESSPSRPTQSATSLIECQKATSSAVVSMTTTTPNTTLNSVQSGMHRKRNLTGASRTNEKP
eukprot:2142030-Amphidinium_carterae.1